MHALNAKSELEKYDGVKKSEEIFNESIGERVKLRSQKSDGFNKMITGKDEIINRDLFKKYLQFQSLSDMQEELSKTQNAQENKVLLQEINNEIINLKRKINKMSKNENEKTNEIIDAVVHILDFNEQNQRGQGLKIITAEQMLSRLPISLAQLKVGNNSQEFKFEIKQLLDSLYRSKKLSKTIYNSLINAI